MASISKYVLVSSDDVEDDYEYDSYSDAVEEARKRGYAVISREYEYSYSALVWTPDGSDVWPHAQV